ncbi:unnamed protein product [Zymoseptoria tritici ST99CH_3D7]|uniref:Rhamnogalacturonase A/B/Epimerase-like pectate lyase domain-containing protein n=1 Tax=Zymoseptoria tritici (strain ST99CH_3D7) TaxID=1276538 RepID=A0A1X7RN32_ZYMT9|nr:unnamed protein product [Zymoseptoria tritici ST99CH_3D7]
MHFSQWLLPLLAASSTNAQIFVPQAVQQLQQQALSTFSNYTNYNGPSTSALNALRPNTQSQMQVQSQSISAAAASCDFWMESIGHRGVAAFNSNPSGHQVFRNVKTFGAKGDGVTDDTAAINAAISSGSRCAPGSCGSTTTTPAVVYFPAGTYVVSASIIQYYYTNLIGNPLPGCMPVIKASPRFSGGLGVIDSNPYQAGGALGYGATNVFWRQIRNLVIDMTAVPASSAITGLHWPSSQATSLQNLVFKMSSASGTQHQGIFCESGSGGFMNDLIFYGGRYGANWGNQQFTTRNLTFYNAQTAINQIWDWGWTYQNININNCSIGLDMSGLDTNGAQTVGSVTFIDSTMANTAIGIKTARSSSSQPNAGGSLVVENVRLSNVRTAIQGPGGALVGAVSSIAGFLQGNTYTPTGPNKAQGSFTPNSRPSSLLQLDGKYYQRSKPQYERLSTSSFLSARSAGATGNGRTDDTTALQNAINSAKSQGKVLYLDHGDYLVSKTIYIPAGSKIVGEVFPVILSTGSFFNNVSNPQPVVKIGNTGESGSIEWSDTIVSTQGKQVGAILIQYNLVAPAGTPSGLWDVHTRIGGFAGSNLSLANCPKTPGTTASVSAINANCISGYLQLHINRNSTGLYLENVWLWTADHDVEDNALRQITIYTGRGLLDQSTNGPVWMVGTGVEHNQRYQYQFGGANNVYAGQIQTETAYYQANPNARLPFPVVTVLNDPQYPSNDFITDGDKSNIPAANGWGLRVANSGNIFIYGAGEYSFFNNYSTSCSDQGSGAVCQSRITSIENSKVNIYNHNTVGTRFPLSLNGVNQIRWSDNQNGFIQTEALFRN